MGQRANLIIIRNGSFELYYDHWCANRLEVDLFWGSQLALSFIEQREPCDASGWLDEVWCEGGAIVDVDRRRLIFFGGEDILHDVPLRRAHLALMQHVWRGWEVQWAYEGIVSLADYVGIERSVVLNRNPPDPAERFWVLLDDLLWNDTLFTWKRQERISAHRVSGYPDALELGIDLLDPKSLTLGGKITRWDGEMPFCGFHLDNDRRTLSFWNAKPKYLEQRVRAAWPGWTVTWLKDSFEDHLLLAGIDLPLPVAPLAELQYVVIKRMRAASIQKENNPARDIAKIVNVQWLNPATDETRGSVTGAEHMFDAILTELESQIPVQQSRLN